MLKPDSRCVADTRPAVHHEARRLPIDMLVMHYTGMPDDDAALERLCGEAGRVSCHYFVGRDGRVVQMVAEERRAWHAGASYWRGESDSNSRSIGIEIANPGHEHGYPDFPDAQIEAVIALSRDIVERHAIAPHNVVGHSDIAPGRKCDPGEKFPWERLHAAGIGHWVAPEPFAGGRFLQQGDAGEPVEALQTLLRLYGYGVKASGEFDEATRACVAAFQRHFRPEPVDGVADTSTVATLRKLIGALAED